MELKLYNRLKRELLGDFAAVSERHNPNYQKQVEAYASSRASGLPQPIARRIQRWLGDYNRLRSCSYTLRYYQILALYFTEHVLQQKRDGKGYADQKALAYWMATGSGKTLLMHLNILQYIEHIGGGPAFDELQIILTTPGVNLIEQHERELGAFVAQLNRLYSNRIKLFVATTAAFLNKEDGYFNLPDSSRIFRLVLVDEGHIGLASGGKDVGAFKQLRHDLLKPGNSFLFEYSATYHGIADAHVREYEEQIVYDYNYYRFFKDGYGKDYALQSLSDDRFADTGQGEAAFFGATFETLREKLDAHARLTVSSARGARELPFKGSFPDKPLLAFMGNTVEDPKNEGKLDKTGAGNDEVSDIRKFVVWLAHLNAGERERYAPVFNDQYNGKLTLTRSPGIGDEIWLSFGDGEFWGLINVGNGEKFFSDCESHPALQDTGGEPRVTLRKAAIVNPRCHFDAIDDIASPINVLLGSRKFAEGWNCFRLSVIGLINLGSSKGNKIIQIYGRGVRLKGLRHDGKRRHLAHNEDYASLVADDTPENRLRRLETLNVFSLNRSWLATFLKALEQDIPKIAGPYTLDVQPAVVRVGGSQRELGFEDYQHKLHAFKVGRAEFDASLHITIEAATHKCHWRYVDEDDGERAEVLEPFAVSLDYRANRNAAGHNLVQDLKAKLENEAAFISCGWLKEQRATWSRQRRVQCYWDKGGTIEPVSLTRLLGLIREVEYDYPLEDCSWTVLERLLDEIQRDVLEKVFQKVRYDIDKRQYRYDVVRQSTAVESGDFIHRYALSYEFDKDEHRDHFELDDALRQRVANELKEERGEYHIFEPLLNEATDSLRSKHKLRDVNISPDKLNAGERKFLRDIRTYIEENHSRDPREFYLMRNVESLRSIGLYLEGETRAFYPDFVLWIVDDKRNKTTLALFDPKGQTGIVKQDDLGLNGGAAMNDKVRVATNGQLSELEAQLGHKTRRAWEIQSFILLRDSSPLGRWKGSVPTDDELELAEAMISRHVLRLDWHTENENGQASVLLRGEDSYLSRIFGVLAP